MGKFTSFATGFVRQTNRTRAANRDAANRLVEEQNDDFFKRVLPEAKKRIKEHEEEAKLMASYKAAGMDENAAQAAVYNPDMLKGRDSSEWKDVQTIGGPNNASQMPPGLGGGQPQQPQAPSQGAIPNMAGVTNQEPTPEDILKQNGDRRHDPDSTMSFLGRLLFNRVGDEQVREAAYKRIQLTTGMSRDQIMDMYVNYAQERKINPLQSVDVKPSMETRAKAVRTFDDSGYAQGDERRRAMTGSLEDSVEQAGKWGRRKTEADMAARADLKGAKPDTPNTVVGRILAKMEAGEDLEPQEQRILDNYYKPGINNEIGRMMNGGDNAVAKALNDIIPVPKERVVGKTYNTPNGPHVWRGTGWEKVVK